MARTRSTKPYQTWCRHSFPLQSLLPSAQDQAIVCHSQQVSSILTYKGGFSSCGCTALGHCNQARTLRVTTTKLKKIRILGPKNRDAKCKIWKQKKVPKNGPQVAPSYGNHKEGLILGTIFCVLKVEPFCGPCGPFLGRLKLTSKNQGLRETSTKKGPPTAT